MGFDGGSKNDRSMKMPYPKGTLIPIGGGEDKTGSKEVLQRIVQETGKKRPKVCVVTVATNLPKEVGQDYKTAFKALGIETISLLHFESRPASDTPANIQKVKDADAVLFSGGNQLKLSSLLGGTKLLDIIKERYYDEPDFVIAGTSAGAAAMSDTMIIGGSSQDAMIKGELELTNGLDFINSVFIDTHFTQRGRFGRLIQTVTCNPGVMGLGLGEDTAVVIYKGNELEVVGSGLVVIAYGISISYTDLTQVEHGHPITVENIKMHIIGPGKKFLFNERKILLAEPEAKK